MDQYRLRGRVDSDLGIEMGYGCRELYQKKWVQRVREREKERELYQEKWVQRERERERDVSEKMGTRAYNKGVG